MNLKILGSNPVLLPTEWETCLKWQEPEPLDREMLLTWTVHLDYKKEVHFYPMLEKQQLKENMNPPGIKRGLHSRTT